MNPAWDQPAIRSSGPSEVRRSRLFSLQERRASQPRHAFRSRHTRTAGILKAEVGRNEVTEHKIEWPKCQTEMFMEGHCLPLRQNASQQPATGRKTGCLQVAAQEVRPSGRIFAASSLLSGQPRLPSHHHHHQNAHPMKREKCVTVEYLECPTQGDMVGRGMKAQKRPKCLKCERSRETASFLKMSPPSQVVVGRSPAHHFKLEESHASVTAFGQQSRMPSFIYQKKSLPK